MASDRAVLLRRWGRPHIMRGDGSGTTFYLGSRAGAPYLGVDLRGHTGWATAPHWMPGGWEFYTPTIYYGRLFSIGGGYREIGTVKVPYKLIHAKRMLRPSYRRAMREDAIQVAEDV